MAKSGTILTGTAATELALIRGALRVAVDQSATLIALIEEYKGTRRSYQLSALEAGLRRLHATLARADGTQPKQGDADG